MMTFTVVDKKTGEYPDLWKIALKEEWAKELMYCDMEGFAIEEDGTLILLDECGRHAYCPEDRFEIKSETPITNADKIRGMDNSELAEFIAKIDGEPFGKAFWLDWLNKGASGDEV